MVYNPNRSKDGRMAHEGGNASFHDIDSGNVYGTHEGDKREGSHAPDIRITRGLGRGSLRSAAERKQDKDADAFLRANGIDPDDL